VITPEATATATSRRVAFLPDRYPAPLVLAKCQWLGRPVQVSTGERRAAS
jgi:hypothetical protein